ncbi:hypothetical protein [Paenibacillus elgii]|uniref:hypothetical protein n=1 Tax=Paenibacillus elgii TaxID=189691 RepID=UPI001111BD52|nr:hypothetical protein [Paenibacillus elgii]
MEVDNTKTVKLYKWENLQADSDWPVKRSFSMWYCGHYDFVDCDEGVEYVLPEGYVVAENDLGEELIYDHTGDYCEISISHNKPVLYSNAGRVELVRA